VAVEKRKIGPFELEKKLGVGGMGVVYLATYQKTGEKMAVKVLSPELITDKRLLRRFLREMAILKKLRHRNIVRYFGGGHDGTQHFYAMELMDGGSMEQLLKKKGKLPWEQVVEVAKQIAKALEHAHNHGIIHRDLKPANLFLSKDGRLKLGDFGIARDTQATALTAAGRTVGTYAYMAPEQISGKPPVSRKTDLYALGCLMYEALTGQTPFTESNPAQMLFAHLELEPPRVSSLALDCPIWLDDLVMKLLEKDPEDRYYDALAVQVALDEVTEKVARQTSMAQQTAAAAAASTQREERSEVVRLLTGQGKKKKKKKKKKVPFYEQIWFLAACLVVLIAGVTWAMWPLSEDQLFARAVPLMETDDPQQWREAREKYLDPLREKFPDGPHAPQVQQYIDKIEMDIAERQATTNARLQREAKTEGERLYREAYGYETRMNDRISALRTYRSMVELLAGREEDRAYVMLAQRKIRSIEESGDTPQDTVTIVNDALARADESAARGELVKSHEIWNSVVTLYASNQELERQVKYARARLAREDVEPIDFNAPKSDAEDPKPAGEGKSADAGGNSSEKAE